MSRERRIDMAAREEWEDSMSEAWAKGVIDGFMIAVALKLVYEAFKWVLAQ